MSDLVERLRKKPTYLSWSECRYLNDEAANEIERLSCEVKTAFFEGVRYGRSAKPDGFWPLLPHEVEQVVFPNDPVRRRSRDYDATRELARSNLGDGGEADRHDLQRWRPVEVAGRDLVLLRLGRDITDSSFNALRQALDRHRRASHKSQIT